MGRVVGGDDAPPVRSGYDDGAPKLPPLTIHQHTVATGGSIAKAAGSLFASEARALDPATRCP